MPIAKPSNFSQELIVGERYGRTIVAGVPTFTFDAIVGERYGRNVVADVRYVAGDVLVGQRVGRDIAASVGSVYFEALIKIKPICVGTVVEELLVSLPDDPTSPKHQVFMAKQTAVQERDPLPHPTDVWSWTSVYAAVQQAVRERDLPEVWPRSEILTGQVRAQVLLARASAIYFSTLRVGRLVRQVLLSRGQVYVPTSGVYVTAYRLQAVLARVVRAAPQMWSNIDTPGVKLLALMSRQAAPAQPTDEYVAGVVLQALQGATRPASFSADLVGQVVMQALVLKVMDRPTDQSVAKVDHLTLTAKEMPEPRSEEFVAKVDIQALQAREPEPYIGYEHAAGLAHLSVVWRYTVPAGALGSWNVAAQRIQYTQGRTAVPPAQVRHFEVRLQRVSYIMERTTLPPGEVIDPNVGRHIYSLAQQMTTARMTITPEEKMRQQRTVHQVAQHALSRDTAFPPPPTEVQDSEGSVNQVAEVAVLREGEYEWPPVSVVTVARVAQTVLCVDPEPWPDPTMAASDAVLVLGAQVALATDAAFPDGHAAQAVAELVGLAQAAVSVDADFPDGHMAQALLDVLQAGEVVVSEDRTFPSGDTALSSADLVMMGEVAVARDNSLVGNLPSSPAIVTNVAQTVVQKDPTLNGIPTRPRGPRPSVTLTRH